MTLMLTSMSVTVLDINLDKYVITRVGHNNAMLG